MDKTIKHALIAILVGGIILILAGVCGLYAQEATITEKPSYEIILEQKVQQELNAELNCSIKVVDQARLIEKLQKQLADAKK